MGLLVLGTVQLGMPYGVANKTGKPDQKKVTEIVRAAWEGGIREFDTAQEYGASEMVLGVAFRELKITDRVCVVSKLRKNIDIEDSDAVVRAVKESIVRLGVAKLHTLLLHDENALDRWGDTMPAGLHAAFLQGLVKHVGISVYSSVRALQALHADGLTAIQVPASIADRRCEDAGFFEQAKERGIVVYVRSIFLQGLFLMEPDVMPLYMEYARPLVEKIAALAHVLGVSRQTLALQYMKQAFSFVHVLVGAETPEQVQENSTAWNVKPPTGIVERVRQTFNNIDDRILDPRKWPILKLQNLVTAQKPEHADAIIWLQGNMYDRGAKVLELYEKKFAPVIVVTGNNERVVDDDCIHVDDIVAWLKKHGVSADVIVLDHTAFNTYDQAVHVIALAKERGWHALLLVGSTHHQLRAFLTFLHQARLQEWTGKIINQPVSIPWDAKPSGRRKITREAFQDEIEKLRIYEGKLESVENGLRYLQEKHRP